MHRCSLHCSRDPRRRFPLVLTVAYVLFAAWSEATDSICTMPSEGVQLLHSLYSTRSGVT